MKQLKNYSKLLGFLYKNEIEFIEEISIIERMYIYPDIAVFVDDPDNITGFLLIQKNHVGNISAYIKTGENPEFLCSITGILKDMPKVHVQCDKHEKDYLKNNLPVKGEYQYQIMVLDESRFNPVLEPVPVPITTDLPRSDLDDLSSGNGDRFREEVRHGIFYGFKVDDKWASMAGAGVISENYMYLYVWTGRDFRGKGYGRAVVSYCMRDILKSGKKPVYALDPMNNPSIKIAQKLGFAPYMIKKCLFSGDWSLMRDKSDDDSIPDSSFYC